jgi:subfamily B ATP-binding cassette protein MsbA
VLGEATSDLDSKLKRQVQKSIESRDSDYRTVAIAHRLYTVKHPDRIHTGDAGEIIRSGTSENYLIKMANTQSSQRNSVSSSAAAAFY